MSIPLKVIIRHRKGDFFYEKNLEALRSNRGVSISEWNRYIGKKSKKNYKSNQPLI